jgi:enoyl-CoA hydratase
MPLLKTFDPDGILILTLSRPDALNALNSAILDDLRKNMQEIYQNVDIRGIIITGDGDRAFAAGADIKELSGLSEKEALALSLKGQQLFHRIENCPKPVIASINGFALGGGCELAMACHVRIAVETAKLGQPEANLGIIPGYGGTQRLAKLAGPGKALELILTGDLISATEAKEIGLVNHIVTTQADLMELSKKIMYKILEKGPIAVAKIIESVHAGFANHDAGYQTEAQNFAYCVTTQDFAEGTKAFLEKRKPNFKGK